MKKAFIAAFIGWTSWAFAQRPSEQVVTALVETARQRALAYTETLPDFLATEIVHRYTGGYLDGYGGRPIDVLTIQLRYYRHKEDHKLTLVDGKPTKQTFDTLQGTVGTGEFGSTLAAIFEPASQIAFHWQSWKTVRGRKLAVIGYEVTSTKSRYRLGSTADGKTIEADCGYHGELDIDPDTGEVVHFEYAADHIPESLGLTNAKVTVDYGMAEIAGRNYLLPARSELLMGSKTSFARNIIEFREYRKFSADSTVDFGPAK